MTPERPGGARVRALNGLLGEPSIMTATAERAGVQALVILHAVARHGILAQTPLTGCGPHAA
jgi:hypothetical protein